MKNEPAGSTNRFQRQQRSPSPLRGVASIAAVCIFILTACNLPTQPADLSVIDQNGLTAPTMTPFQPVMDAKSYYAMAKSGEQPVSGLPQPTATQVLEATATSEIIVTPLPSATNLPTSTLTDPGEQSAQVTPTPDMTKVNLPTAEPISTLSPEELVQLPDAVTFLLLGSDTRGGTSFRTDTILIGIVRPKDGTVSLISIPRDLWVNIPWVGENRINVAYQYGELYGYPGGGPGLLKETIKTNLGIEIDFVAMVDFNGFRQVVDTIGGIDVPVVCAYTDWRLIDPSYDPEWEDNWNLFTAGPGVVHMDGDYALWYARSRKMSNDFDRGRRQQEVIRAIFQQVGKQGYLSKLPELYRDLSSLFITDVSLIDLLKLAPIAVKMSNADIRSYYIAHEYVSDIITAAGAYVLLPNIPLIHELFYEAYSPRVRPDKPDLPKVEVLNGSSIEGMDVLAAERLNYAGYQTIITPFEPTNYDQTLIYTRSAQPSAYTNDLLSLLQLPVDRVIHNPQSDAKTDLAIVVGNDFQACFKPDEIGQ